MKHESLLAFVLTATFGTAFCAHAQEAPKTLSRAEIASALYCMEHSNSESLRKFSGGDFYVVRYEYGVIDPQLDQPNKLHLIIYSRDEKTAWLYEVLVERKGKREAFRWVNSAQLRREDGKWLVTETLGGTYNYDRVFKLANQLSGKKKEIIPRLTKKPESVSCEGL